jgi:glycerol-3-phosphate O-acyltransferase
MSYSRAVLDFVTRTFLHFGQAMDLFGNRVDADGRSVDMQGRTIDLRKYVEVGGVPHHDANRDAEYTRELGQAISDAFMRNNVALTTHVVAFTLFQLLRQRHRKLDLYHLIRLPGDTAIPVETVKEAIARLRDRLIIEVAAGRIFLSPTIQGEGPERILEVALRYFQMYHFKPLATQVGDQVLLSDIKLLHFYHNRLTGYGLEKVFEQEIVAQPGEEWANV